VGSVLLPREYGSDDNWQTLVMAKREHLTT
jgi:hypothetical protein